MSDKHLLEKYDITYQGNFEKWAQILHESEDVDTVYNENKAEIINFPQHIIRAYLSRKLQFEHLVKAFGGEFIWGLQPFIHSKKNFLKQNITI